MAMALSLPKSAWKRFAENSPPPGVKLLLKAVTLRENIAALIASAPIVPAISKMNCDLTQLLKLPPPADTVPQS